MRISAPNTGVELGANITINITDFKPAYFDRLDCGIMRPGDSSQKIIVAQYDKYSNKFIMPSYGIPKDFQGRVKYYGSFSFSIRGIHFNDKSLKVVCLLNYQNGSMTSHVQSQVYEVKEVYGKFNFL